MSGEPDKGRRGRGGLARRILRVTAYVVLAVLIVAGALWGGDRLTGALAAHNALAELQRRGILARLPSVEATAAERHPDLAAGDPNRNGTTHFEAAFAFAQNDARSAESLLPAADSMPELGRPFGPQAVAILKGLAASRRPFFDAVRAGRARPVCLYPFKPVDVLFAACSEVSGLRSAARFLRTDALLAQAKGDTVAALDDCAAILDMTHTFGDCSLALLWLVRGSAAWRAFQAAEETLSRTTPSAEAVLRLRGKFVREADAVDLRKVLGWEVAVSVNILRKPAHQQTRIDTFYETQLRTLARTPGITFPRRPWWKVWEPTAGWRKSVGQIQRTSAEAVRRKLRWYDRIKLPMPELARDLRKVLRAPDGVQGADVNTARYFQHVLINLTVMRVAAVALSVEAYRAEHGAWPAGLGDLEGVDTTDPFSGAAMRYNETEEGRIVYSIGANGTDDGGRDESMGGPKGADDWAFRLLDVDRRNRE